MTSFLGQIWFQFQSSQFTLGKIVWVVMSIWNAKPMQYEYFDRNNFIEHKHKERFYLDVLDHADNPWFCHVFNTSLYFVFQNCVKYGIRP